MACNHCVHPKCAGVCPTDAYVVRNDGIVYIDESKCMGCGYCAWACPYAAPQYNPELRLMTKCNFCYDNLDAGLPPTCVAACPMRVLGFTVISDQFSVISEKQQPLWQEPGIEHPFPLPQFSRTQPHLAIKPHSAMTNSLEKTISNWEEIQPQRTQRRTLVPFVSFVVKELNELPLIIFTLGGQMAAGIAAFSLFGGPLTAPMLIMLGGLIGLSGLVSLLHLGTPLNAWRALNHLRKSWLSREVLMFGLFGASWLVTLFVPGMGKLPLAICGIGTVYSMAQVYRLRSVQAWDTHRTLLAFVVSTVLLGGLGVEIFEVFGNTVPKPLTGPAIGMALVVAWGLSLTDWDQVHRTARRLRLGLIVLALAGVAAIYIVPVTGARWMIILIFIVALVEEVLGRWLFYESRQPAL